jgi:putative phage-type endonuclease
VGSRKFKEIKMSNKPKLVEKPSNRYVLKVNSNTPEWLDLRKLLIGGSDIGAIFQANPWVTRHHLWEIKIGLAAPNEATFRMNAGHFMEEGIAQMAIHHVPEITTINPDIGIRIHHKQSYLSSTLDRWGTYVREDGTFGKYVLDCKNSGVGQYQKYKKSTIPPYHYWLQIQQQLLTTQKSIKADKGYLACWLGGQMLKVYSIEPCIKTQENILKYADVFQNCVLKKTPPTDDMFVGLDDYMFELSDLVLETSSVVLTIE